MREEEEINQGASTVTLSSREWFPKAATARDWPTQTHNCLHMQSSSIPRFPWRSPCTFGYALVYIYILVDCILYSGKPLREKTFANYTVLWLFAKVFSAKFGDMVSFGTAKTSDLPKFSLWKSYFHQFTKVFSLKSFPIYGSILTHWDVGLMSGGVAHSYSTD